ncbi:MAG: hypothetical protein Q4C48_04785 [Lachnospiraceae bacterium]|nr:hypothetical protein [Lachnospiraceae bacterium]
MKRTVLALWKPAIRAYLGEASAFSVLGERATAQGWLYDKYISLTYEKAENRLMYEDSKDSEFGPDDRVFIKSYTMLPPQLCKYHFLIDFIMESIDGGEYVITYWNEIIVRNYLTGQTFQKEHYHICFIYGYDAQEEYFLVQGYLLGGNLGSYQIPFDVLWRAVSFYWKKCAIQVSSYEIRMDISLEFQYKLLLERLQTYCNGKIVWEMEKFWRQCERRGKLHLPSLYCIFERNQLMLQRISFLEQKAVLSKGTGLWEEQRRIVRRCHENLLLGIRQEQFPDQRLLKIVTNGGRRIAVEENKLTMWLLETLRPEGQGKL